MENIDTEKYTINEISKMIETKEGKNFKKYMMEHGDEIYKNTRKEITKYEDIIEHIKLHNDFHDMRIGNIDYDSSKKCAKIYIEDFEYNKEYAKADVINVWFFELEGIEKLTISLDVVLRAAVLECSESDDKEITIVCDNGSVTFKAKSIKLNIPKVIK